MTSVSYMSMRVSLPQISSLPPITALASAAGERDEKRAKKVQLARVVIQDLHEYSKIAILRYLKTHLKVGVGTPKLDSNDLYHIGGSP